MGHMRGRLARSLLVLAVVGVMLPHAAADTARPTTSQTDDDWVWTTWLPGSGHVLADDGQDIWIGETGNLARVDKVSGQVQRYTYRSYDGLPLKSILAIAVDEAGNRWFGGDGGLARLDSDETWTYFTTSNSGISSDMVDAIAVGVDGTLWLSHGWPDGTVSRRDPTGAWRWYPHRSAAVAGDYVAIRQTINNNRLWTVAGEEVWAGYAVFDGAAWVDRTPYDWAESPTYLTVDSAGVVWAFENRTLLSWNGSAWAGRAAGDIAAVDGAGAAWIASMGWYCDPPCYTGYWENSLTELAGGSQYPLARGPVLAMLASAQGVWVQGPGWLRRPDGVTFGLTDVPWPRGWVGKALSTDDGQLWLHSADDYGATLYTFDDAGTTILGDDLAVYRRGGDRRLSFNSFRLQEAFGLPDGGLWLEYDTCWRGICSHAAPMRWVNDQWVDYGSEHMSACREAVDLFAQDASHLWFACESNRLLRLDDRGTPADLSDDLWTEYPLDTEAGRLSVAVDTLGRPWYLVQGAREVHRYDDDMWFPIPVLAPACQLIPASDGTMFLLRAEASDGDCGRLSMLVGLVQPNGAVTYSDLHTMAGAHYETMRSTSRPNPLWAVAPEGVVWYRWQEQVMRRDAYGLASYPLPVPAARVDSGIGLLVTAADHVWLVSDGALWRLSRRPDFSLAAIPAWWWLQPGSSQSHRIRIASIEGYKGMVSLTIAGLPGAVAADVAPNPVQAGNVVTVTLRAGADADFGVYPAQVIGVSDRISHTMSITITIAPTVYTRWFPLLRRDE